LIERIGRTNTYRLTADGLTFAPFGAVSRPLASGSSAPLFRRHG
jgi:hypothetical protein